MHKLARAFLAVGLVAGLLNGCVPLEPLLGRAPRGSEAVSAPQGVFSAQIAMPSAPEPRPGALAFDEPLIEPISYALPAPLPGRGHLVIRVKFPERHVAAFPANANFVRLQAKSAKYDQSRTVSAIDNVAEFLNVPAGPIQLSAKAYQVDPSNNPGAPLIALAIKDIVVESGAMATTKLKLQPPGPIISGLQAQMGGEGASIFIRGDYFGTSEAYQVFVDGKPVAAPFRTSSSSIEIMVPAWATQSAVQVDIQSGTATQSAFSPVSLARLKALDLGTSSITIVKGAVLTLFPKGIDTQNKVWESVKVAWTVNSGNDHVNHDHGPGDPHAQAPLQISADNVLLAVLEGEHHIMARNGKVLATASVKVILPSQVVATGVTFTQGVPTDKKLTLFAPVGGGDAPAAAYPSTGSLKAEVVDNTGVKSNSVKWSVAPPNVATVSISGALSTLAAGTAVVTAKSNDGNAQVQFDLTVKAEGGLKFDVDGIPADTHLIRLTVKNGSGYSKNLDTTEAEKSATFTNVPAGSMTIEVKAYNQPNPDNPGTMVLASASATVTIKSGAIVSTKLTLTTP